MNIPVLGPIPRAFERMLWILFKPFDLKKWLLLGFCAFLAYLGECGSGGLNKDAFERDEDDPRPAFIRRMFPKPETSSNQSCLDTGDEPLHRVVFSKIRRHLPWIIIATASAFTVIGLISALVIWLRSRGKFMFLDGLVHNRGAVIDPWCDFRQVGNSLFGFLLYLLIIGLLATLLILVIGVLIAWPDIQEEEFGVSAIVGLASSGLLFATMTVVFLLIAFMLENFVIPTMYLRRELVMDAWLRVRHVFLSQHLDTIVLFLLMRILLAIVLGHVALATIILTCCCVAALPYVGTVILLPFLVFSRCYTLCFLEQFGPEWRFFAFDEQPGIAGNHPQNQARPPGNPV
ncbi:MAG: hypothetical protein JSU63_06030 [Phycisphaerales bacterium]|nr:MAG: hypothetical protein JSU63_06030 [Phycisphaerales bacterium]